MYPYNVASLSRWRLKSFQVDISSWIMPQTAKKESISDARIEPMVNYGEMSEILRKNDSVFFFLRSFLAVAFLLWEIHRHHSDTSGNNNAMIRTSST